MTTKVRRYVFALTLLTLLTVPFEFVLYRVVVSPSIETRARNWAASRDSRFLEQVGVQLQEYPMAYRRALLGRLPPEKRAEALLQHVDAYVAGHPELTPEQQLVISDYRKLQGHRNADGSFMLPPDEEKESFEARARQAFSRDRFAYLFLTFGPPDREVREPLINQLAGWLAAHTVASADQPPDCDCNVAHDWCDDWHDIDWHCGPGDASWCREHGPIWYDFTGCGLGLVWSCDGLCLQDIIPPGRGGL